MEYIFPSHVDVACTVSISNHESQGVLHYPVFKLLDDGYHCYFLLRNVSCSGLGTGYSLSLRNVSYSTLGTDTQFEESLSQELEGNYYKNGEWGEGRQNYK